MKNKPPKDTDLVQVVSGMLVTPSTSKLEDNPLALYMSTLRSKNSRRSILSALDRAACIFDAFDRGLTEETSDVKATSYDWAAPGAITFAKAQAAISIVAEEGKAPMARLLRAGIRGLARAAFNLYRLDIAERTRIFDIRPPELSGKQRGRRLRDEEIQRLIDVCIADKSPFGYRDAALIGIMLATGLRRFEVSALNLGDYKRPKVAGIEPIELTVWAGKGNKFATVAGDPDAVFAIDEWVTVRGEYEGPMFSSSPGRGRELVQGSRLTPSGIYMMCVVRGCESGVPFSPHDLRRTAITKFLEKFHDLSLAQRFARHSDPSMTAKYDKRDFEALKDALRKGLKK